MVALAGKKGGESSKFDDGDGVTSSSSASSSSGWKIVCGSLVVCRGGVSGLWWYNVEVVCQVVFFVHSGGVQVVADRVILLLGGGACLFSPSL